VSVKIETATINLLDKLYQIEKQSFQHEAFSKRLIGYLLRDYNAINLVARLDDEIVGCAIGRIEEEGGVLYGHVFTLETLPPYRHMGVGQKLLRLLEEMFSERGAVESRLEVREDNVAAISLYLKFGYEKAGRIEGYYGNSAGLFFKKKLFSKLPAKP
jgi:[ribosomal protein S18]-alanine N-acetyltransferase